MTDGGSQTADVSLFTSDETDEWATPPEFLRPLAEAVGGFDLDAASGAENSPIAEHAYTEDDDGLAQPWFGTVWCNPPYSEMATWTDKVVSELHRDDVDAILYLCKGDTSTDWWHQALAEATAVGMLDTRLSFGDGSDSAPFASHVFVFGDVPEAVFDALDREGAVFDAADKHERTEQRKLVTDGGREQDTEEVWQPRFYAACALSTSLIVAANYILGTEGWTGGFIIGFGVASVLALVFLSVQHWSLAHSNRGDAS
ncbi:DNA N-6-adenine-methyltransferase [Haloparvum sp. AD34]